MTCQVRHRFLPHLTPFRSIFAPFILPPLLSRLILSSTPKRHVISFHPLALSLLIHPTPPHPIPSHPTGELTWEEIKPYVFPAHDPELVRCRENLCVLRHRLRSFLRCQQAEPQAYERCVMALAVHFAMVSE